MFGMAAVQKWKRAAKRDWINANEYERRDEGETSSSKKDTNGDHSPTFVVVVVVVVVVVID